MAERECGDKAMNDLSENTMAQVGAAGEGLSTLETPAERIDALLKEMGAQKPQLLAILDFCREERTSQEIDAMLEPLRAHRTSVYDGIAMRSLLEQAGALLYISNDEQPEEVFDEAGNLVLPEPAIATWLSTADGLECLYAQDSFGDLLAVLEGANEPASGFVVVLESCCKGLVKIADINAKLQESGVLEGSTIDPTAFVSKLEDAGALEWRNGWTITELGEQYLAHIRA